MENSPYSQQIKDMIEGRATTGPGMINDYKSSLATAAGQDQQSIDSLRGIYSDPSKFEKSKWGALGLGLMKGTKSGSFNENMYNGLAAATEANDYNREQNLSREEKLAKLSSLQAQLTRQTANDTMGVYDKQTGYMAQAQADQSTLADINLANAPKGPRMLNPGEAGPQAPGATPLEKSMKIINDFYENPDKYKGPDGQAIVSRAFEMQKAERLAQSRESKAANKPSYGQIAADKKFGGEVADWYANGGESDYQKQISQLSSVHSRLTDKNKETSGFFTGRTPDWVNSWWNQGAIDSREQVAEVVQRNLKNILGAQFTQKEGDNLISRAYNPTLDEATNARRVNALMTQMEQAHKVKAAAIKYFEQNGTLEGFNAPMPTIADFNNALDQSDAEADGGDPRATADPPANTPPSPQQDVIPPEAVDILKSNPSPEARAWFDQTFGDGAADEALMDGGAE